MGWNTFIHLYQWTGSLPVWYQVIIWINVDKMSAWPLRTNFSEILNKKQTFHSGQYLTNAISKCKTTAILFRSHGINCSLKASLWSRHPIITLGITWHTQKKDPFHKRSTSSLLKAFENKCYSYFFKWGWNLLTILHMPWQVRCHDMCKLWLDLIIRTQSYWEEIS